MSFGFKFGGKAAGVAEKVKAVTGYGDTHQCDAAKSAALAILEKAPEDAVVVVEANGHHDYSGEQKYGNVLLKIEVFPG